MPGASPASTARAHTAATMCAAHERNGAHDNVRAWSVAPVINATSNRLRAGQPRAARWPGAESLADLLPFEVPRGQCRHTACFFYTKSSRSCGAVTRCPQVRFYEVCHWNGNWRGQLSQWQRAGTASHMGGDTRGGSEPLSLGILPYECSLPSSLACVGCPRSYTRIAHPLARPLHSQEARVAAPLAYPGSTEA